MNTNINLYKMSENREKKLWEESIIVFDSSALLDIYFLPKATREEVFENHFKKKLEGRLWIPSHVSFEYQTNREQVIKKPIIENYKPLKDEVLGSIKKSISVIGAKMGDLKNKTKKDDRHPYLKQEYIDKYLTVFESFKNDTDSFEKDILKQISEIENEINNLPDNDDVLKAIEKYFQIGREYDFKKIIEITKEGEHRYKHSIPPGYKDQKDKKGFQIFGDLIIWKQIIEYASETQKSIVFICNDLKEDWCYLDDATEKRIKSPREELIKEIFNDANVDFWMYNLPQFLYKSNEYLFSSGEAIIDDDKILKFSRLIQENKFSKKAKSRGRVINEEFYNCDECDGNNDGFGNYVDYWIKTSVINEYPSSHRNSKFDFAYTGVCEWCNTLHIECPCCHSVTAINIHQYDEKVECEGGCGIFFFIESDPSHRNMDSYEIKIIDHRVEECSACGEEYIDDGGNTGICKKCNEEYGTER